MTQSIGAAAHAHSAASTPPPTPGEASAWLAAVVENSFDAILSKTLDGVITSWNAGAERLFGFSRDEAIGQPITLIIPPERLDEEAEILARLRRGERIERFQTVRRRSDGELIDIELTVSPVCDSGGRIVGASTIAHDVSALKRQQEAQNLIIREMNHRIKNLLAIAQSIVSLSRRGATDIDDFADDVFRRLSALTAAHQLILVEPGMGFSEANTRLGEVLHSVLLPYLGGGRVVIDEADVPVGQQSLTSIALLLHELATNAVKYGGLSNEAGLLRVTVQTDPETCVLHWCETGGQPPDPSRRGFGTDLLRATLRGLGGTIEQTWNAPTLDLVVSIPTVALAR
jgi:PAS domain S-box-containing protein